MSGGEKQPAPAPIEVLVSNAFGKGVHIDELAKRLAELEAKLAAQPKKGGA